MKEKAAYKRIILVQSPLNVETTPIPSTGSLPPLGLLSLATYLDEKIQGINIRIVDGDLIGLNNVLDELKKNKPEIVGIGIQASESYVGALEIAKKAKDLGAKVVLGGEQVSLRPIQVLRNRAYVDNVVVGQGEQSLEGIILGEQSDTIPNLAHRKNLEIILNPKQRLKLSHLPIPNRKYIDLEIYAEQFQRTSESKLTGFKSFTTVKTQDGCMKAIKKGVCTFCKREDLFLASIRKPTLFWQEMKELQSLGIDYVWDVSPSFSSVGVKYLRRLVLAKSPSHTIRFRVYARADDLASEDVVSALKEIGVENVLVGWDSGNEKCLASSNKRTTLAQHRKAAENLRKYKIATYSGFVLGHLAEDYKTMQDTLKHAKELRKILGEELFRVTTCSKLQLYPDNTEYRVFLDSNPSLKKKSENEDNVNMQALTEAYFEEYLHINPQIADEISEEIRSLSPIKSGKDMH